jgi:hypothetical protein
MNYQFAPFRMGISDVTPEEMEQAKAKVRKTWSVFQSAAKELGLAVADVSLHYTANAMHSTADGLKKASVLMHKQALKVQDLEVKVGQIRYPQAA